MKSSRPGSAKCRSSKTMTTGPARAMRSKNVRQAANSCSRAGARLEPEQRQQRWLDPAALVVVGDVVGDDRGDLRPGRRLVVGLDSRPARPRTISPRAQKVMPSP